MTEVCKELLQGMVPKFGLLGSLQGNKDPSFIAKVNQELAFSLGIIYYRLIKRMRRGETASAVVLHGQSRFKYLF